MMTIDWAPDSRQKSLRQSTFLYKAKPSEERAEWSPEPSVAELNPAVIHARRTMAALGVDCLGPSGLTEAVQVRVREFLRATTDRSSTYASIVPDDDGVAVLHWVAGPRTVQVDIESTGPSYAWVYEDGKACTYTDPDTVLRVTKDVLKRIAKDAASHNPHWRERMRRS